MSDKPYTIGFCGRSGSGKSYVSEKFASKIGALYIDADKVYHSLTEPVDARPSPCTLEIGEKIGEEFICKDGALDRKKLSKTVYSDSGKREILNRITHAYIKDEIIRIISENSCDFVALDAALLPFSPCFELCDFTVVVISDEETSLKRITERDGISQSSAAKRLKAQPSVGDFLEACDSVILNGESDSVDEQISTLVKRIKHLGSD